MKKFPAKTDPQQPVPLSEQAALPQAAEDTQQKERENVENEGSILDLPEGHWPRLLGCGG